MRSGHGHKMGQENVVLEYKFSLRVIDQSYIKRLITRITGLNSCLGKFFPCRREIKKKGHVEVSDVSHYIKTIET